MLALALAAIVGTCQVYAGDTLLFEKELGRNLDQRSAYQKCQALSDQDARLNRVPTGIQPPARSIRVIF